jgi:GT2 family glycosyltransferase
MPDFSSGEFQAVARAGRGDAAPRQEVITPARSAAIDFDEPAYLAAFNDVIVSLDVGEFSSARDHFEFHGRREGRLTEEKYIRELGLIPECALADSNACFSIDTIVYSQGGSVLVVGWVDDRDAALSSLSIFTEAGLGWNTTDFGRVRRPDAEAVLKAPPGHLFGFWIVLSMVAAISTAAPWTIRGRLLNGHYAQVQAPAQLVTDTALRTTILSYLAGNQYFGNQDVESFLSLEGDIGQELIKLNRKITKSTLAGAWVSYYGPAGRAFKGSIIVCLYGKLEYFFLQSAIFAAGSGLPDYEFVFVSNSPELTESLEKEAKLCSRIYGISIVLVCLPDNAGFGAANNIAARYARSNRLLVTNPDVFPREADWARKHAAIVENAPPDTTRLFGAPLYYGDGSLMHHGMYFELDTGISVRRDGIFTRNLVRTEHYGKGAPAWSSQFACPRKVAAVSGAFMSAERGWFERLEGFNEDFLFGHYEDADLSLRSLAQGSPVWIHDFPLWHMEGKGSCRRIEHEGGSLVNRWIFTRRWGDFIADELHGPNPSCAALGMASQPQDAAASKPARRPASRAAKDAPRNMEDAAAAV